MAYKTLKLVNISDYSPGSSGTNVTVASESGNAMYLYVCSQAFQATTNINFLIFNRYNPNAQSSFTISGNPKYIYFFLAFDEDQGSTYEVSAEDAPFIMQARMDTGPVVVVDDGNYLDMNGASSVSTNGNGAATITLPSPAFGTNFEGLYLIAYKVGNRTKVQRAICTTHDARIKGYFPYLVNRLGIEFFEDHNTKKSLQNQTVYFKVFPYKKNEVPAFAVDLL